MEFVINHYLVAWSCRGMCGTKLKNRHALLLCHVESHDVVSYMCELGLSVTVFAKLKLSSHMCDTTRHHAARQITRA